MAILRRMIISKWNFLFQGREMVKSYNQKNVLLRNSKSCKCTCQWEINCRKLRLIFADASSFITPMNPLHYVRYSFEIKNYLVVMHLCFTMWAPWSQWGMSKEHMENAPLQVYRYWSKNWCITKGKTAWAETKIQRKSVN